MDGLLDSVQHAWRTLIRRPTFTLMTVGILAVGVAGIATIWSVFHELYLKPLPIPDCGRMVTLNESAPACT